MRGEEGTGWRAGAPECDELDCGSGEHFEERCGRWGERSESRDDEPATELRRRRRHGRGTKVRRRYACSYISDRLLPAELDGDVELDEGQPSQAGESTEPARADHAELPSPPEEDQEKKDKEGHGMMMMMMMMMMMTR
eukprot:99475-Hanusia_phi.AAC.1